MKLVGFLIFFILLAPPNLQAEDAPRLKTREWASVYSLGLAATDFQKVTFDELTRIYQDSNFNAWQGKLIELQGYFQRRDINSFRISAARELEPGYCAGCVAKAALLNPKIILPPEALERITPGLIRVQGVLRIYPDRAGQNKKQLPLFEVTPRAIWQPKKE